MNARPQKASSSRPEFGMLQPAALHMPHIARQAHLEALSGAGHCAVMLVQGGPGSGKTALLADWRAVLTERRVRCAWMTIVEAAMGEAQLLTVMSAALRNAGVDFQPAQADDITTIEPMNRILSAVSACASPVVLFMDDVDQLADLAAWSMLSTLIQARPDNLRFAFGARRKPQLPIAKLATRGLVHTITGADLNFASADAACLLRLAMSANEAELILPIVQGWGVALQLAMLWYGSQRDSNSDPRSFAKSPMIASYLSEQVVGNLTRALKRALMKLSVFVTLDDALAEMLGLNEEFVTVYDELIELAPLVLRTGAPEPGWKVHPLLAAYLHAEYRQSFPDEHHQLTASAAKSLLRRERVCEAVQLARQADVRLAAQILEQGEPLQLALMIGMQTFKSCLATLDGISLADYPGIQLACIFAFIREGRVTEALKELTSFDSLYTNLSAELRLDRLLVDLLVGFTRSSFTEAELNHWRTKYEMIERSSPVIEAALTVLTATSLMRKGLIEQAEQIFADAEHVFKQPDAPMPTMHMQLHSADLAIAHGELRRAAAILRRVANTAKSSQTADNALAAMVKASRLWISYELDDSSLGHDQIATLLTLLEQGDAHLDYFAMAYTVAIHLACRMEGRDRALEIIERARQLMRRRSMADGFETLLRALQCSILLLEGDLTRAVECASELDSDPNGPSSSLYEIDMRMHALGYLAIEQGEIQRALKIADDWLDHAIPQRREFAQCRGMLLRAAGLATLGEEDQALVLFRNALMIATSEQVLAPFMELPPRYRLLFEERLNAIASSAGEEHGKLPRAILHRWETEKQLMKSDVSRLSSREREVLHKLAVSNGSNKEIARELGISHHAVKFHLKNIFRKLQVDSRDAARNALPLEEIAE
jgi:LuxR family transcriptional regulator, maltose regulon positive regulatory protein